MNRLISACIIFLLSLAAGSHLVAQPLNVGREFYMSFPANWDYAVPDKHVRLYITSDIATEVKVYGGPTVISTRTTIPDQIIEIDIPLNFAQPFTRNDVAPVPPDQIYVNKAIRVVSDDPIIVYGINRVTYTTDGILALPISALGQEYIVASAPDISDHNSQKLPSQYVITAPHDNTVVTIVNTWDTYGHVAGETVTVAMNKGDVYSAMSKGQLSDLTGTVITSSRPVAVLAGINCTYLPDRRYAACDHLVEMMSPVTSWGKVYHLVPFMNRLKGDFIRLFSGAPNTSIEINGEPAAVLPEKGGEEGRGWFTLLEPNRRLLEFTSNNPIAVAQYNNSQQYDHVNTDPFFLMLTPLEQYQRAFSFSTPGTDYPQNFINLVMDSSGWSSMEISENGSEVWTKLSDSIDMPQNFPTLIDGVRYSGVSFEVRPGAHRLRSRKPFAGYIYGWSSYDSYGYPLGAMVANIAEDDFTAPLISATDDHSGRVLVETTDMPAEASRRTELSTIELDPSSSNFAFDPRPVFDPAESRSASFTLKVVDRSKDARAILVVSDMRGNISRDTFTYIASSVMLSEAVIDFGLVNINTIPYPKRVIVLRNLVNEPVTIDEIVLTSGTQGFRVTDPTGPFVLASSGSNGDSKEITIEFAPTTAGRFVDSIGVRNAEGLRMLAMLRAVVGTPRIMVTDIDFGEWRIGDPPKEGSFKIRNTSNDGGLVIVTQATTDIASANPAIFTTPDGLPAFPLSLGAGAESGPIKVTFNPAAESAYTDEILFLHNAGADPANDSVAVLNGQGRITTAVAETGSIPGLSLGPVAPTPAVDWTTLRYQVPSASSVEITLVDATGRTVATVLEKSAVAAGDHTIRFDLSTLPAGSYFCRMIAGERLLVHPFVVR